MRFRLKRMLGIFGLCTAALSIQAFAIDCGDYVRLGTYNEADILWRVVAVDKEKTTLLSDEIITFKAFDAKGKHEGGTSFAEASGNGLWSVSNLRTWLNSSSTTVSWKSDPAPSSGNVTANPYENEKGFLANLTAEEQDILTEGSYLTILNHRNQALKTVGTESHLYNRVLSEVLQNYENTYKQELTDKVFIPSIADVKSLDDNIYTYGMEYQVAPLASPLKTLPGVGDGSGWFYWLRDSMFADDDSLVRCMRPDNTVEYDRAYNGNIGVRPMCYIKSNLSLMSGKGTKENPYVLRYVPKVWIDPGDGVYLAGSRATLDVSSVLLPQNGIIKVYRGSEYLGQVTSGTISFLVEQGANIITAEAYDSSGKLVLVSDPTLINGTSFAWKGKKLFTIDFEGITPPQVLNTSANLTAGFNMVSSFDDSNDVRDSYGRLIVEYDAARGSNVGKLQSIRTDKNANAQIKHFSSSYKNKMICIEMDFCMEFLNVKSIEPFSFSCLDADGSTRTWRRPLSIDLSGALKLQEVKSNPRTLTQLEAGKWYNLKMMVHNPTNAFHAVLTKQGEEPQLICYNEIIDTTRPFSYVNYGEIMIRNAGSKQLSFAMDNLYGGEITQDLSGNEHVLAGAHLMDDNKTVSVTLHNASAEPEEHLVLVAEYTKNRLMALSYHPVELDPQTPSRILVPLEKELSENTTAKVFVWDSFTGIYPEDQSVTITK